jgi:hypothetical protein
MVGPTRERPEKTPSRNVHGPCGPCRYHAAMEPTRDEPLPATLAFVFSIGTAIAVGWVLMFLLLRARW